MQPNQNYCLWQNLKVIPSRSLFLHGFLFLSAVLLYFRYNKGTYVPLAFHQKKSADPCAAQSIQENVVGIDDRYCVYDDIMFLWIRSI